LLNDPQSAVYKLVYKYRVALPLFPEKGTHPNVFYVPPFNPSKEGQPRASILEDPRLPLKQLKYFFGDRVIDVMQRLEMELRAAQAGRRSEVLQLLIGRNAKVRYHLSTEIVQAATPAPIRAVSGKAGGPKLTRLGNPTGKEAL
jgi:nitrate reductase beta subunit